MVVLIQVPFSSDESGFHVQVLLYWGLLTPDAQPHAISVSQPCCPVCSPAGRCAHLNIRARTATYVHAASLEQPPVWKMQPKFSFQEISCQHPKSSSGTSVHLDVPKQGKVVFVIKLSFCLLCI